MGALQQRSRALEAVPALLGLLAGSSTGLGYLIFRRRAGNTLKLPCAASAALWVKFLYAEPVEPYPINPASPLGCSGQHSCAVDSRRAGTIDRLDLGEVVLGSATTASLP